MYRIEAVEERHIVLASEEGRFRIDRYCTHEGGDLSLGPIEGDILRCPLHSLPFCLKTGRQPCQTLKNLTITRI